MSAIETGRVARTSPRIEPSGPTRIRPALRVHEAFEALAAAQPDAPAIITDQSLLSYGELERRANALANALLAGGVEREEAVGVLAHRSAELPQAFLAIVKAGGAYVAMGADLPAQRLASMAAQAGMRRLIALDGIVPPEELRAVLGGTAILRPEELNGASCEQPKVLGGPSDLAAIFFTSGSTGHPKGVLLQHDACINMGYGHIEAQGLGPTDRVLLASAPGFILGFRELCLPMLAGAACVAATRALLDEPARLLEFMARQRVTVALFTPSYLRLFERAVPAGLRCLLTAGERPNSEDARAYARRLDYWNIQGATEVCGTICMAHVEPAGTGALASGRPFPNTSVYLLDQAGREVAPGEIGEIHVIGVGVARGYLKQPELTAERFVETKYGRAYRTTDMGRWNEKGELESMGRADDVVKVSGQAVSLGEIEQSLARYHGVRRTAAMQHEGRLIAFVESDEAGPVPLAEWHQYLAQTLPAYMLPAQVTAVRSMPVNVYGKVDRQSLIALAARLNEAQREASRGASPQGEVERQVAEVWELVLGVRAIGRSDNLFALGGTSLRAIEIGQRLQKLGYAVTAQDILVAENVAMLAERIVSAAACQPAIEAAHDVATTGQADFWIAWKLGLATPGLQISRVLAVRGSVPEPERWQAAWTELLTRHAALRTVFYSDQDEEVRWRTLEMNQLGAGAKLSIDDCVSREAARERIAEQTDVPFALSEAPLARAGLVRVAGAGTFFWFTLHHAVVDGLSARIVQEELHALMLGQSLAPARSGVAAASRFERSYLASSAAARDRAYWQEKLDGLLREAGGEAFRDFAPDHPRVERSDVEAAPQLVERLDAATVEALTKLAQSQQAGLHALMLALLAAEARRRDGRHNLIVGSAISLRPSGEDRSVGYFVNILPLISTADNAQSFAAQIRMSQSGLTGMVEHGNYPASLLYRELRQRHPDARPHGRISLFDVAMTANPSRGCGDVAAGLALAPCRLPGERVYPVGGVDLAFSYEPIEETDGGGLELMLVWNARLYRRETAQSWLSAMAGWARWFAQDVGRAQASLPALQPEEAERLARWEHGPAIARPAQRFHELVESISQRNPEWPAVVCADGVQSYGEIEEHANRVAHALLEHGVAPQEPVAVLTEATTDLPATLLGIWKAGAVYLPLALELPPERLAYMAGDAGARVLIVLDGHPVPPPLARVVRTTIRPGDWSRYALGTHAVRPRVDGSPRDLAYIIYTSGTSGVPKGSLLQHDSLVNVGLMSGEIFGLTHEDRFSLAATPGFDASLWELSAGLLNGMAIVPVSSALRDDPWAMKRYYTEMGVTVAFHAPSYLRVSEQTPFVGLRVLVCGGEAPTHEDARHHVRHTGFWNAYGPTETCIFVCAERVYPDFSTERPLPVGRPGPNTILSIRRANGDPVPPGVQGEVWIGGRGVARGYLNNPELNAQRFVETSEGRFYRSGDLGRWTEEGLLELGSRIDFQIKLHGQRVELGEVEHALLAHRSVAEAVTLVDAAANGTQALRAFVRLRANSTEPGAREWREFLADRLPVHMIPGEVVALAAMPLTTAGKIDREALLQAPRRRSEGGVRSTPASELERQVAAVWHELLGGEIAREDNFFALGGNSLLAVTVAHRLSRELAHAVPARELFAAPTLAGFAQRIAALAAAPGAAARGPVAVLAGSDLATEGQREFYTAEAAGLDTRTFTIPMLRRVEGGKPSKERWSKVWATLVARHDALRTYFYEDTAGQLRRAAVPALLAKLEFATRPDEAAARAYVRERQAEPFLMGAVPLWRAGVVTVTESGEQLLWLALHHALGDGRSLGVLVEELAALLRGETLAPLAGGFAESAAREEAYLVGLACMEDAQYWRELLERQPSISFTEGPLDFPRSITAKTGNHRFETHLDEATTQALRALARRHSASLHAVMTTIYAFEARRRMSREDVVIGTTSSIRETAAEAQVVGYYVNMLPLPVHLPAGSAFGAALRETQRTLEAGLQHTRYPFARIYHEFWSKHPEHNLPSRYPLFDLAITENPDNLQATDGPRLSRVFAQAGTNAGRSSYELTDASPGPDMVLIHEAQAGGLMLQLQVNASVYSRETAEQWFTGLRNWATWLAGDAASAEQELPELLLCETELLDRWEQGPCVERPALRFDQLFERMLDTAGPNQYDRPAVVTESGITTYGELESEANAIAHALLAGGIAPGAAVGVLTGRSAHLPATALGIWKAGATYLPLATDLPPERLLFMARDVGVARLVALGGLAVPGALKHDFPAAFRPEELDAEFRRTHAHRPARSGAVGDTAYIIYTSGSTGRPKGTPITHASYVNLVLGAGETLGLTWHDRTLMFSSPSFDVSLSDIGLPLAFGASVCPAPFEVLNSPIRFRTFLSALNVTVADLTPSYLRLFNGAELPSLRILVTGGEAPIPLDVQIYGRRLKYFNAYGPTENTISSTMGLLAPDEPGPLTAGRPLPNTSTSVCDETGRRLPPGMPGELWLGGAGLAHGYLGLPAQSAVAFVETPRGRRYRSGDLARWRMNGELEILGRIDDQVKLNGIRVELGEIEHALGSHPDIAQAVALLDGAAGASPSLWAFVCPLPGRQAPAEADWREYLTGRLPAYMIPSTVIAIPAIPLSNSGKIDKRALKVILAGHTSQSEEAAPKAGLETEIARVWSEVLGRGAMHRDDNFFALGGHSLLAIAVANRLEEKLGHPVPARELFAEPMLRAFAERVSELSEAAPQESLSSDRATEGQREFWVAEQAGLDTRGFNMGLTLEACGPIPHALEWRRAWAALVARHAALRTAFRGDRQGILRRAVCSRVDAEFELATRSDRSAALALAQERQSIPFVLETAPLWRAGLVQIAGEDAPIFWLALHHSVGDGVSLGVLVEDFTALLSGAMLAPVAGQFDASAGREESYLDTLACEEDAAYWRQCLRDLGDGAPGTPQPFDEWPLDHARPLVRSQAHAAGVHVHRVKLDRATTAGLRDLAQSHGASLHALLLTLMAQEVRRRTGRPEFPLGTAANTRDAASEERVVGYYVNMLPVPCRQRGPESIAQSLRNMQKNLAEGLRHVRYPFARMYRDFREDHPATAHPARYPLFDLAVTENPALLPGLADAGILHFRGVTAAADGIRYQLRLNALAHDMVLVHEGQADGGLVLQWLVNAAIYDRETAAEWIDALTGWARELAGGKLDLDAPWPVLLPEEAARLATWERGAEVPHPAPSLPARFEHWAAIAPDRIALVTEQGTQSYGEMNARANALAHALLERGVARREPVGVLTDRSLALPETVLAIWKAGACYLPLAPDLPPDRMAFIARDAGIRVIVVLDGHVPPPALVATGCQILRPESLSLDDRAAHADTPQVDAGPVLGSDLAFIIYTSGSTGVPKGVVLLHQGLMNLGVGMGMDLQLRSDDRTLLLASPAFDAWISDVAMSWTVGAALVPVLRSEMSDIDGMRAKIARLGVTSATMTPSYLRLFEQADLTGLRVLLTVGEAPHRADALHYAARLRYINGYGPSENTAAACLGEIQAHARRMTAGRPLINTAILIRGQHGEPVPPGATGLIWLGGMGLAAGYLNRPDLTAASFVETLEGRLYCTGDLGRWTCTGELEVLGRSDGQVKLRGQRIELGEIEHRLGEHPGVLQAVALVETRTGGAQTLWAFVCLHPGAAELPQAHWQDHLSATLPSYMLPAAVLTVPSIPVGTAGKVDRTALLRVVAEQQASPASGEARTQPHDGTERRVAQVWAEHLECRAVTREDYFFDLGGNSLRAISVVSELRRAFHCTINDLYENPRLADFAAVCRPRPDHLRTLIQSARRHWRGYQSGLAAYEAERAMALAAARRDYESRNQLLRLRPAGADRQYARVLLTGATGYLGSYLLRDLLKPGDRRVSALVRGADDRAARARLGDVLVNYFGPLEGAALRDDPRLTVVACELRRDDLGLAPYALDRLADGLQAVIHCAANVKHFGHYWEFHADNVAATARLLSLAGRNTAAPADFHYVSTLSACGRAPEAGFRLFTEYDPVPETPDENYYIRSKQEAERMVTAARATLANACIHRVGNVVFAAAGGALQHNIAANAFFRQLASFLCLGVVPDDSHLWLCHVDLVACGLLLLAERADLANLTHHLENPRQSTLAEFATAAPGVRARDFGAFLECLEAAVDEPHLEAALMTTLETFGLYRGVSPQARARRIEVVSERTAALLAQLGLVWPPTPPAGQAALLRQAARLFASHVSAEAALC